MDRPLHVTDMQIITLISTDTEHKLPLLVVQFPCDMHGQCLNIQYPDRIPQIGYSFSESSNVSVCCSAVHLINVSHAHIHGIQVAIN